MASKARVKNSNERSILPEHFVDVLEDAFHGLLGIILEYLIRSYQNLHSYERLENGLELMVSECIEKEDL